MSPWAPDCRGLCFRGTSHHSFLVLLELLHFLVSPHTPKPPTFFSLQGALFALGFRSRQLEPPVPCGCRRSWGSRLVGAEVLDGIKNERVEGKKLRL